MKKLLIPLSLSFIFCQILISTQTHAQVNLQTGAFEYAIPLHQYTDAANNLELSTTLSYTNGSGLKVQEIPSEFGSGWQLQCGGFVQRIQNGEPDDQKVVTDYPFPYDAGSEQGYLKRYYPDGYMYSSYSPDETITNSAAYMPAAQGRAGYKLQKNHLADRELDLFMVNLNGRVVKFIIGKNSLGKATPLDGSKVKISFTEADLYTNYKIRTRIKSFEVTDESGIQYLFENYELTEVCRYDEIARYSSVGQPPAPADYSLGGAWFLQIMPHR